MATFGFLLFSLSGGGGSGDIGIDGVCSCCSCPPSSHHSSRAGEKVSGVVDELKEQWVAGVCRQRTGHTNGFDVETCMFCSL